MSTSFLALQTRVSPVANTASDALASCQVQMCILAVVWMEAEMPGLQEGLVCASC